MRTRLIARSSAVLAAGLLGLGTALLPVTAPSAHADGTNKMMLVMDSSGSMKEKLADGKTKIGAARSALNTVIDGLPSSQQVGLRVYGAKVFNHSDKGACTDSQKVVDLGTDNRSQLKTAVKKYKPYGETPTGYALKQAGKDLGSTGQRTIVLVSDGEPTCSPDPCAVARDLSEQGIDLKIEVVGLDVSGKAKSMLQCVAKAGNGHYYDADSADDIGDALDTVATRSLRPYKPGGKPITGTEESADAPRISAGDWLDKIGGVGRKRGDLFYTFHRTIAGSTLHISASITNSGKETDGLQLRVFGDDESCGVDTESYDAKYGQILSVGLTAPGSRGWNEKCSENDDYTIEVTRGNGTKNVTAEQTVPLELRVLEEPPVKDVDSLPKELPEAAFTKPKSASATKIVGGSSFAQATDIKPGSYTGNLVPGEVQLFQIPVDWGQHLTAQALVKPLSQQLQDEIGTENVWFNVRMFSPSRARAENSAGSDTQTILSRQGAELHVTGQPVVYRNRESYVDSKAASSKAGNYYLAVGFAPIDSGKSLQIPYTLNVAVDGTVQGEPTYLKNGTKPTASSSASTTSTAGSTPSPAATTSSNAQTSPTGQPTTQASADDSHTAGSSLVRTAGIAAAALGGLLVVGGIAALVIYLVRRRR